MLPRSVRRVTDGPGNTQTGWDIGMAYYSTEARVLAWMSRALTDLTFGDIPKPGLPRVHWLCAYVCMPVFELQEYMVAYYVGYHPPPE